MGKTTKIIRASHEADQKLDIIRAITRESRIAILDRLVDRELSERLGPDWQGKLAQLGLKETGGAETPPAG